MSCTAIRCMVVTSCSCIRETCFSTFTQLIHTDALHTQTNIIQLILHPPLKFCAAILLCICIGSMRK